MKNVNSVSKKYEYDAEKRCVKETIESLDSNITKEYSYNELGLIVEEKITEEYK